MRPALVFCLLVGTASAAPPLLKPAALDATDRHARLEVSEAGRYTLRATSAEGTALRLIDRMSGTLARAGSAGGEDGRIDAFLDAGEYRVLVERAPKASGRIELSARHVAPIGPEVHLEEFAPRDDRLADGQARAWWIRLDAERVVVLEAAGRALSTLRIWQDGRWIDAAEPRCTRVQPTVGKPVRRCLLTARLPKGLHRVVAYGGAPLDWSEGGDPAADRLDIQWGIVKLAPAGARRVVIGPSGVARFQVPDGVSRTILTLAQPGTAQLAVSPWIPQQPFSRPGAIRRIDHDAREHVADISRVERPASIEIEAAPGTAATLRWFPLQNQDSLVGPGRWLVGSVHANDDGPPVTGVVYRTDGGTDQIVAESVITVGPEAPLRRSFNLASDADLFLRITHEMTVRASATEARLRLYPLWTRPPAGYQTPDLRSRLEQVVTPGLYRLGLLADRPTITTLTLHAADRPAPTVDTPTPTALDFGLIELGQGERRMIFRARTPVPMAVTRQDAPAQVDAGVPLTLAPGAVREVPLQRGPGRITAIDLDGRALQVSTNGLTWAETLSAPGETVFLRNPHPRWVTAELRRRPASADGGPLPPVTAADRALLPVLETLDPARKIAVTMDREQSRSWRLSVPAAGAWLAESTGLLATSGALRTRTRISLDPPAVVSPDPSDDSPDSTDDPDTTDYPSPPPVIVGASGRNFGIERYLRAGEYLLTVKTTGASRGRMGLALSTTPVRDEGLLVPDRIARVRAKPGEAVAWRFALAADAKVQLNAEGPAGVVRCRIEDADGWPIDPPVADCDHARTLPAGAWRIIVLPTREGGLRRVRFRLPTERVVLKGAGPHPIALDRTVEARWQEPANGAPRVPQVFAFEMPAAGEIGLQAPPDMLVEVHTAAGRVARVSPGQRFDGVLERGPHTLQVVGARRDDGVEYSLHLEPTALMPGLTRSVAVDEHRQAIAAIIPVEGLYTFTTEGPSDARLRLLDPTGALVAVQDDRPDDWDARLTRRLTPGRYTVEVELETRWASTRVGLEAVHPTDGAPIALGATREAALTLGGELLPITGTAALIAARMEAQENVGIAIEAAEGQTWRTLAAVTGRTPLVAARPGKGAHRLRIWSLDGLERPAKLSLVAVTPAAVTEAAWQRGSALPKDAVAGIAPRVTPGAFVIAPTPGLLICPAEAAGCEDAHPGGLPIGAAGLQIVGIGGRISGRRIQADEAEGPVLPVTTRALVDLPRGKGPVVFEASAPIGQPAVALGDAPQALVQGRALAVDLTGAATQGAVWSSDGQPLNTRQRAWRLVPGAPFDLAPGRNTVQVPPGTALTGRFADGPRRIHALVPRGGIAVLPRAAGAPALAWGAFGAVVDGARGVRDAVHLLNPGEQPAVFEIEVIADASGVAAPIAFNAPFEARMVRGGVARLAVAGQVGARLTLRGASGSYARADGQVFWIADGGSAPVGTGGQLVLRHGVGPVLAWTADAARPGPWAADPEVAAHPIDAARQIPLAGAAQRFTIRWPEPRMLHLRLAGDVVLRVERPGGETAVLFGGAHDLWLPEGAAELTARGLAGTPLAGELLVAGSAPVALTEGVGAPILLGPGDTRLYRFTTTRTAAIGVGVRADADRVRASVLDSSGRLIASGGSVMPELTAGDWLLALHLPADAAPVEARPALIGIAPRDDSPPLETIRSYVENAR